MASPKFASCDLQPEMSAPEVGNRTVEVILSSRVGLIVLNFANPDMVGQTARLAAAIKARCFDLMGLAKPSEMAGTSLIS